MHVPRVAVIGVGAMGARHARVAAQSSRAELAVVIDPRREVGEMVAAQHGAAWAPKADDSDLQGVDAIIVAGLDGAKPGRERIAPVIDDGAGLPFESLQSLRRHCGPRLVDFGAQTVFAFELEKPDQGTEREPLNDQSREHDREGREHDQVSLWKRRRQRERGRQRDQTSHAGPADENALAHGHGVARTAKPAAAI